MDQKMYDLEQEKNNSLRNERIMEERLKYLTEEKDK